MRILCQFFVLLLIVLLQSSCSIEKRRYRPGYHIDFSTSKVNLQNKEEESISKTTKDVTKIIPVKKSLAEKDPVASISQAKITKLKSRIFKMIATQRCDTLFLENGKIIGVQIIDFIDDIIRYKECDNLEGPNILIKVSDIKSIKYANGHTEYFKDKPKRSDNFKSEPQLGGEFGILSFVAAVLFFVFGALGAGAGVLLLIPAAIIFGIIGLNPKRKYKGFATAGLVLGGLLFLLLLISLLVWLGQS